MLRFPDGSLRNLTKEAGFGMEGLQGANSIAVREPAVHWSGTKAIFSMVVGATAKSTWQLYEVTGLGRGQTATIKKLAGQPEGYNNIGPIYGTDERVLFISDRPFNGQAHLYPMLDEYESTVTTSGIYSINPLVAGGDLKMLSHTPSGASSLSIDSAGRVIFTRWDHLQRDQQADAQRLNGAQYGVKTFASEAPGAADLGLQMEFFPESRQATTGPYGKSNGFIYNIFSPWQVNQDGTDEQTLNHVGRHELNFRYLGASFPDDRSLVESPDTSLRLNTKDIFFDGGLFYLREDPARPGSFIAVATREFGNWGSHQIVRMSGALGMTADKMAVVNVTPAEVAGEVPGGRFRNPLPMLNGNLVAAHTPTTVNNAGEIKLFQLRALIPGDGGLLKAGPALTPGLRKTLTWYDPDTLRTFDGLLWELEPVEVVARSKPTARQAPALDTPERSIFQEEQVDEVAFRDWMKQRNLALMVTRNVTTRDGADKQQPYNLRVPGGVKTIGINNAAGRVYDIASLQIVQANLVRGYAKGGRRVLGQPMQGTPNPAVAGSPAGSVKIGLDGSTAAFVPAQRALSWQTTDPTGEPVVRERVWVTFQPGEIKTCASCHGVNKVDQAGAPPPANKPEALRALIRHWKTIR